MVCFRIRESGSYQDSANAYAKRIWIWEPLYIRALGPRVKSIKKSSNNPSNSLYCNSRRENRVNRHLHTEKREGERLEIYMRSVPLTTSPASSQLYIYLQQSFVAYMHACKQRDPVSVRGCFLQLFISYTRAKTNSSLNTINHHPL